MFEVSETPEFSLHVQYEQGIAFMHCEVFSYSPKVKKEILKEVSILKDFCENDPDVSCLMSVTENGRFAEVMGGEFHSSYENDNKIYGVYRWE